MALLKLKGAVPPNKKSNSPKATGIAKKGQVESVLLERTRGMDTLPPNRHGFDLKGLQEIILERRATSHFKSDEVPLGVLDFILRLAGQAPSGYNLQPWRFIVVRTTGGRARLKKAAMDQAKVSEAPVVIIAVGMKQEPLQMAEEILTEGARKGVGSPQDAMAAVNQARKFLSQSPMNVWVNRHTMIAFTYLMLAAEACGYDTAPMEGFDPDAVKREFGIPDEGEVVALLAIGRMKEPDKAYPGRLPVHRIAFQESFGIAWPSFVTDSDDPSDTQSHNA